MPPSPSTPAATPATITTEQVRQVARLSRLRLTDEQVTDFTQQLGAILGYVQKLDELDLDGVEPLYHPGDQHSVTRDDTPGPALSVDEALSNAPDRAGDFFKVPRVLGDGGGA